eukprot:101878_1
MTLQRSVNITWMRCSISVAIVLCIAFTFIITSNINDKHKISYANNSIATDNINTFPFFIFQIGFNKCGTLSIHQFFDSNNISSKHHIRWRRKKHFKSLQNIRLFKIYENKTMVYTDFGVTALCQGIEEMCLVNCLLKNNLFKDRLTNCKYLFSVLDKQYNNSKFILNIRNIDHWIKSRFFCDFCPKPKAMVLYEKYKIKNLTEIIFRMRYMWNRYLCDVLFYFQHRMDDLLIFNIEADSYKKIIDFFRPWLVLQDTFKAVAHNAVGTKHHKTSVTDWNMTKQLWNKVINQGLISINESYAYDEETRLRKLCFSDNKIVIQDH